MPAEVVKGVVTRVQPAVKQMKQRLPPLHPPFLVSVIVSTSSTFTHTTTHYRRTRKSYFLFLSSEGGLCTAILKDSYGDGWSGASLDCTDSKSYVLAGAASKVVYVSGCCTLQLHNEMYREEVYFEMNGDSLSGEDVGCCPG